LGTALGIGLPGLRSLQGRSLRRSSAAPLSAATDDAARGSNGRPWWRPGKARSRMQWSKRTLQEKIAAVPAFMVCSKANNPYLEYRMTKDSWLNGNYEPEYEGDMGEGGGKGTTTEMFAFMFVDYADAEELLREKVRSNPTAYGDAHVVAISWDRALRHAASGAMPTGHKDDKGEDLLMRYVFAPSAKAAKAASRLAPVKSVLWAFKAATDMDGKSAGAVEGFEVPGWFMRRGGERVRPVFLSYEDLVAAWQEQRAKDPRMPLKPPRVAVVDALGLAVAQSPALCVDAAGQRVRVDAAGLEGYGLVPGRENAARVGAPRRKVSGKCRPHTRRA